MDESQKKISFAFSKLKKPSSLVKPVEIEKKEVEYVDSFDFDKGKFSYQGTVRNDEEIKKPLVIPLVGTRSAYDVIKAKLDLRDGTSGELKPKEEIDTKSDATIKNENSEAGNSLENSKPSLETLAAKEIIEGLKEETSNKETTKGMVIVPDLEKSTFEGEKEPTLDDYESVPVDDFGLALLRGMGWTPATGIGKDNRVVAPVEAKVRPKRLGLGAEGAMEPGGERQPLKKGSLIMVTAGQHKNAIGVVEGIDGDTGSVFIKLVGKGNVSLSELIVKSITKKEFDQKNNGEGTTDSKGELKGKKYGIIEKIKTEKEDKKEHKQRSQLFPDRNKSSLHRERQEYDNDGRSDQKSRSKHKKDASPSSVSEKDRSESSGTASRSPRRMGKEHSNRGNRRERRYSSDDSIVQKKKNRGRSFDEDDLRHRGTEKKREIKKTRERRGNEAEKNRPNDDSEDSAPKQRRSRSRSKDKKSRRSREKSSKRQRKSCSDEDSYKKKKRRKKRRRNKSESSD